MEKKYSKVCYIDPDKTDCIVIVWKSGLKEFFIYHNKEFLTQIAGSGKMMKGVWIESDKLGNVFVKMHTKPLNFEIKLGDRYLFDSKIPPYDKLKSIAAIFNFIGVITTLLAAASFAMVWLLPFVIWQMYVMVLVILLIGAFFFVAASFLKKGHLWAYISGAVIIMLMLIQYLLSMNMFMSVFFILFAILILTHFKTMVLLYKHRTAVKAIGVTRDDVIDDIFEM